MATFAKVTTAPSELIAEAVERARKARHHPSCNCCLYRSEYKWDERAGYCSGEERLWTKSIDSLLEQIVSEQSRGTCSSAPQTP